MLVARDATADITAAGSVGVRAWSSPSSTSGPVTISIDDLRRFARNRWHRRPWRLSDISAERNRPAHRFADADQHDVAGTGPSPSGNPFALDRFDRVVATGWGSANIGRAYGLYGPVASFAVDGAAGQLRLAAGALGSATLSSATARDVDLSFRVATDRLPIGGSAYAYGIVATSRPATSTA